MNNRTRLRNREALSIIRSQLHRRGSPEKQLFNVLATAINIYETFLSEVEQKKIRTTIDRRQKKLLEMCKDWQ